MKIYHIWTFCENDSSLIATALTLEKAIEYVESKGEILSKNKLVYRIKYIAEITNYQIIENQTI